MNRFEYASPKTVQQAVQMLSSNWGETEIIAGGTDLLGLMKDYVATPKRVINIKDIPELKGISIGAKGLRIGALTRLVDVAENPLVRQHYHALAEDVSDAASPQIRNMATLGGNLCQRPRCWYFRNGMGLLPKSEDGRSLVLEGDNRNHAILGNEGPAFFTSPSTIAPMLVALNAHVTIQGPDGRRDIPLEKFYRIPQSAEEREHDLKPNEMIVEVLVPPVATGTRVGKYEVRQKASFDWPMATASAVLSMNGKTVKTARIVMGAVAPVPWVSEEAAQAIIGQSIDDKTAAAAGAASVAKARSLGQNGYKIKLAGVAVKRALLDAAHGGAA
jgi:xanthine dehydrogenase YagS FAD-binding subunit